MSALRVDLQPGWQSRPPAVAVICAVGVLVALLVVAEVGALPGLTVALAFAFAAGTRTQWAVLDGPMLHLRDACTAYAFRRVPAQRITRVCFRRTPMPWCRLRVEPGAGGDRLVLYAASPTHPSLRPVTLWMIVHGRRRARIDACLLDALAALPEHGHARQPHDASPA